MCRDSDTHTALLSILSPHCAVGQSLCRTRTVSIVVNIVQWKAALQRHLPAVSRTPTRWPSCSKFTGSCCLSMSN